MTFAELIRKQIPRQRFFLWLECAMSIDRHCLAREWMLLTPSEKESIVKKLVKYYQVDVEQTRGNQTEAWVNAQCLNQAIVTFAAIGNPMGHGLNEARYRTSYGDYPHIENPLYLPCYLVETADGIGRDINHMINAMPFKCDIGSIDSWIFFDRLGIIKPGTRCMFERARILPIRSDEITIRHDRCEKLVDGYVAEFKL